MDEVFGSENFVSQITFQKTGGVSQPSYLPARRRLHPLVRQGSSSALKYRQLYRRKVARAAPATTYDCVELPDGTDADDRRRAIAVRDPLPAGAASIEPTTSLSQRPRGRRLVPGRVRRANVPPSEAVLEDRPARAWRGLIAGRRRSRVAEHARVRAIRSTTSRLSASPTCGTDTGGPAARRTKIYVVQTQREGRRALHADDARTPATSCSIPTCGSGTTAYVAEQWGRRWITIDTSRVALALARQRLMGARFPYYLLADSAEGRAKEGAADRRRRCRRRSRPATSGTGSCTSGCSTSR